MVVLICYQGHLSRTSCSLLVFMSTYSSLLIVFYHSHCHPDLLKGYSWLTLSSLLIHQFPLLVCSSCLVSHILPLMANLNLRFLYLPFWEGMLLKPMKLLHWEASVYLHSFRVNHSYCQQSFCLLSLFLDLVVTTRKLCFISSDCHCHSLICLSSFFFQSWGPLNQIFFMTRHSQDFCLMLANYSFHHLEKSFHSRY